MTSSHPISSTLHAVDVWIDCTGLYLTNMTCCPFLLDKYGDTASQRQSDTSEQSSIDQSVLEGIRTLAFVDMSDRKNGEFGEYADTLINGEGVIVSSIF